MTKVIQSTPAQVRAWFQQRQIDRTPPPSPEEIRRQLGWQLIRETKGTECPR